MHKGFSFFSWMLALFCLPSSLFPLAWFLSPTFSKHPHLSNTQIEFFSIAFWIYPLVLLVIALVLHKLHRHRPQLAWGLLAVGFAAFYAILATIIKTAF
jgi:hypothetical protein